MESRETSKRLFGGKRVQAVWIDTWVAGLHPCGGLNYFTGHFFGVSFDRSFWFASSESVFGIAQGTPVCMLISSSSLSLVKRLLHSWHHLLWGDAPPFWTSKEPFCTCVVDEVSLTSRMKNMWSFISYLPGQKPASSTILLLWTFYPQGENSSAWGLPISCLKAKQTEMSEFRAEKI